MSKRKCKRSGVRSFTETPGCGKLRQARTIIVALCLSCFAATTFSITGDDHSGLPNYDIRNDKDKLGLVSKSSKTAKKKKAKLRKKAGNGESTLAITAPGAKTTLDSQTGVPTRITSIKGVLKTGGGSKPESTVQSFVAQNKDLFGLSHPNTQLETRASYENPENKTKWVTLRQTIGGIPVFQGELRAALTPNGDLSVVQSNLTPGLRNSLAKATVSVTAEEAVEIAGQQSAFAIDPSQLVRESTSQDGQVVQFKSTAECSLVNASQVIFPVEPGQGRMAWQVVVGSGGEMYLVVLDAQTGAMLFRKDLVSHQTQTASYLVYDADSPAPGTPWPLLPNPDVTSPKPQPVNTHQTTYTLISENATANPDGWLPNAETTTRGNNTWAGLDQNFPDGIDTNPTNAALFLQAYGTGSGPSPFNRNFLFPIAPPPLVLPPPNGDRPQVITAGSNAAAMNYVSASVTNMFFWVNRYHDYVYRFGFNEASGNFQSKNFGRGGAGSDPVLAHGQDNITFERNNANFATPPDGFSGIMQMFVWNGDGPVAFRDGDLDQQVIIHELTHGLSNRLVGNGSGLLNQQGGGLGEGWSDFYATSMLSEFPAGKDQDPDKVYPVASYVGRRLGGLNFDNYFYGLRSFPYTTNRLFNPVTYADTDPLQYSTSAPFVVPESPRCLSLFGSEVHNLGFAWSTFLWEVRAAIMHKFEGAGFATTTDAWFQGNRHMLQLATDALKMTPINPTFVEARDAIVDAALFQTVPPAGWVSSDPINPTIAANDEVAIWRGFASRGLGVDAVSPPRQDVAVVDIEPVNYYTVRKTGESGGGGNIPEPDDDDVLDDIEDDDDSEEVDLGGTFTFYGQTYSSIWVNTNGSITFLAPDLATESDLSHHFEQPRISGLLCDLDGSTTTGKIAARSVGNGMIITFWNVPNAGVDNVNNFEIKLTYDSGAQPGSVTLVHGQCDADSAVVGLSPGDSSFKGPLCCDAVFESDLSALNYCNTELPEPFYFTEHFAGFAENDFFDLDGVTLTFFYGQAEGWLTSPVESYNGPLFARTPSIETNGGFITPGSTVEIRVPLESDLVRANLSGVLGLLVPLTDGVNVIDPVADYGQINAQEFQQGLDTFMIQVDNSVPCGSEIQLKIGFTSDQGVGGEKIISFTVGGGFGAPLGSLSWPQAPPSAVVKNAVTNSATSFLLSSQSNMQGGVFMKNNRTNEIISITSYNNLTSTVVCTRAQKGTAAAAMNAGDTLSFVSVPIPASASGIKFVVNPTNPAITGPAGRIRVTIGHLFHPHMSDLTISLTDAETSTSVILMNNPVTTQDDLNNVTFDMNAPGAADQAATLVSGQSYRPTGNLDTYQSFTSNVHQPWILTVADGIAPFTGEIDSWSVEFSSSETSCTGSLLASSAAAGSSKSLPAQPSAPLVNYPNQIYRYHALISGGAGAESLRVRTTIGNLMSGVQTLNFTKAPAGSALAPASEPTHYWADLDPTDVPALYADPSVLVSGVVEAVPASVEFQVHESWLERISMGDEGAGRLVASLGPHQLATGEATAGNLANPVAGSDAPNGRPTARIYPQGIVLDSTGVPAAGSYSYVSWNVQKTGILPVSLQPGKFYLARFHVNSNTPSYGNPALRLRAGVGNGLVDSELWLTSANANSVAENKIAAELLPGPGTKNIDVKGEERQGGYYNVYFTVPASVRADGVSNRLNIGYDLIDYGYDGQGSVEQLKEGGRYTLDSVEIREIPQP